MAAVDVAARMASLSVGAASPAAPTRRATAAQPVSRSSFFGAVWRPTVTSNARRASSTSRSTIVAQQVAVDDVEETEAPVYPPFAAIKVHGTGRRKTAVARVGLLDGTGRITVNNKTLNQYFQNSLIMTQAVRTPLTSLGYENKYDLVIKTHGGGLSAQSQAMQMGIARALVVVNADNKPPLRAQGFITRDARKVERKKFGLKKARKAPQFSKR